jgi:hypothetical protein
MFRWRKKDGSMEHVIKSYRFFLLFLIKGFAEGTKERGRREAE